MQKLAILSTFMFVLNGCSAPGPIAGVVGDASVDPGASATTAVGPWTMPESWTTWRVGGDLFAASELREGSYYVGRCSITTPLPVGYPAPTPPGAIELKRYPAVRRAEMRMEADKQVPSQSGRSLAFWPLFQHIQRREIEMTSPVEMNYPQMRIENAGEVKKESELTSAWTMSFLYRTTDLGPLGDDGKVHVVDVAPMTVLSIGMMGPYMASRDIAAMESLRTWLAAHPHWKAAGPARSLYYNGPDVMPARQWSELQVPVARGSS